MRCVSMPNPRAWAGVLALALILPLSLGACGQNRYAPPSAPLGPEHYVIDPEDVPAEGEHMRYAEAGPGRAGGLDIAITEYRHPDKAATVALFGVVHIADPLYFDAVQRELDAFGTVLYEGVKPEHQSTKAFQASFNEKGGEAAVLQKQLAAWFGFEFQMTALDYTRKNFVHADMSLETFLEAGGDKFMPGAGARPGLEHEDPDPDAEDPDVEDPDLDEPDAEDEDAEEDGQRPGSIAIGGGSSRDMAAKLGEVQDAVRGTWTLVKQFGDAALGRPGPLRSLARAMFAKTMGTIDLGQALAMQPGFSDLILIQRNKVVIERLEEVGKDKTEPIAIFYGAAHMEDLERRLVEDLGYRRTKARWLRAWALRPSLGK